VTGTAELRVASANLQYGGLDRNGSTARLDKTVAALGQIRPQIVLLQELTGQPPGPVHAPPWDMPLDERDELVAKTARQAHDAARRHLHHLAARLGMTPVLGPPVPGQWRRMHTAILVREEDGVAITGTGPPPMAQPGAENPPWTQISVTIEGIPHPVACYSVHLPARAAGLQLPHAQRLANLLMQDGRLAHLGGDINGIPRTDDPGEDVLAAMNPHLRPARMILDDGPLRPDYSVDDTFTRTGLVDIAASLPPGSRVPAGLLPTGPAGSRVDRHYATAALSAAAVGYRQLATGGSDHHLTMTAYDWALLALAVPPGPRD
jgi:hypothetical protein